ncbi:MAG TPA: efflux RND transporter permease subunit [Campylobacterales bacterium]|nr:efflux RND transporter permease subunit [Campylobacterales bacterium]
MFEKILRFFITHARMNYLLFFLVFATGIYSYNKTPKEIFPSFELDMIAITGSYAGSSIDILDKMAVKTIEEEIKNISEVDSISTIITPGKFNIILELEKGADRYNCSNKVKDAISIAKQNLPSDMNDPWVKVLEIKKDLLNITISSDIITLSSLKEKAQELKDRLLSVKDISEIIIRGDSDKYFDIRLDDKKIKALGLSKDLVFNSISKLSYIFPIGKIEDSSGGHFYISTQNGKKSSQAMSQTLLKIGDKKLYLSDIATVEKRYDDSSTLFLLNKKPALSLVVKQDPTGNAIELSKNIHKIVKKEEAKNSNLDYTIHNDNSEKIKDRLNIVISNILLGIILITILVVVLINSRMALVIMLGIPTSFVIGAIAFYFLGYTINMISLVGILIALGIVVDDAIVVSENIQQHIEEGMEPKEAAIQGSKEMAKPVILASLTTLFSFIPALMISGTMGEVMKLIPIAVSVLVVASLIEAFIFLPIHSAHTLKKEAKTFSWQKANNFYSIVIYKLLENKKIFLTSFIIVVPLLIILGIGMSKFQMFPRFDATSLTIAVKADVDTNTQEMLDILKKIEHDLDKKRDDFYIEHISTTAGWRRDSGSNSESYPYVGNIRLELQKLKAQNFVDMFITPYLSFYYDKEGRTRDDKSQIIAKKIKKFLKEKNYKDRFELTDISIVQKKVGPIKSDIKIGLISNNDELIIKSLEILAKELQSIKGITSVSNSARFGISEIKLKINSYGESLGVDEQTLGATLSNMYLSRKKGISFDENDMLEIRIESIQKDSINSLKNFEFPINNNQTVLLNEIVEFKEIRGFEKLIKDDGEKNFYIFANVNPSIITATEAIQKIQPTLDRLKQDGIKLKFKGEDEKKKALAADLKAASVLALVLIMLSMLYLFNSFRDTFILMSVIPFSFLGVIVGHNIIGVNLSMSTMVGALGLAGVVINDGIIMMTYLKRATSVEEVYKNAAKRFRPIVLTSVTTLIGLATLIFFPTGQAVIFQPLAIALGFGLAWGTILNLLYLPVLYTLLNQKRLIS